MEKRIWREADGFNSAECSDQAFVRRYGLDFRAKERFPNWSCVSQATLREAACRGRDGVFPPESMVNGTGSIARLQFPVKNGA